MNKMIEPLTIEDIKAAIHKWDLISRPYALYYHPNDKDDLTGAYDRSRGSP